MDGEMDSPLPKRAVMIMKYFAGLRVLSSPISHSLSEMEPEYHDGYRTAGRDGSPKVLYAVGFVNRVVQYCTGAYAVLVIDLPMKALGRTSPFCNLKSPRS